VEAEKPFMNLLNMTICGWLQGR